MFGMFKRDFRLNDRQALDRDNATLSWEVVEPVWEFPTPADDEAQLPAKWKKATRGQLLVYAVTWLEREVCNGGFCQYFQNPPGSFYEEAAAGLAAMSLTPFLKLLQQAAQVFPHGKPSRVRKERRESLDRLLKRLARERAELLDEHDEKRLSLGELVFHSFDSQFYALYGEGEEYYGKMAAFIRGNPDEFFRQRTTSARRSADA